MFIKTVASLGGGHCFCVGLSVGFQMPERSKYVEDFAEKFTIFYIFED